MESEFVSRQAGATRVIVVFLGWGMDSSVVKGMERPGYDVLAVWDYASAAPMPPLEGYEEIGVVAWSFGVAEAARWIAANPSLPITRRVAVNGTLSPIDDEKGIHVEIFRATLAALSPTTVRKFMRRMFTSAEEFAKFPIPARSFESQKRELEYFANVPEPPRVDFDKAITGDQDRIFPEMNQEIAWWDTQTDCWRGWGHYLDLSRILQEEFVDKDRVAERFSQSRDTYGNHAEVQRKVAVRLWKALQPLLPSAPKRVLEIGAGTGELTRLYAPVFAQAEIDLWDIAEIDPTTLPSNARFTWCDAEKALRQLSPGTYDLILSSSTLQWFNSPVGALANIRQALTQGGCMGVALFIAGTYEEIFSLTGRGLPYPTSTTMWDAMERLFPGSKLTQEDYVARFDTPQEFFSHLRQTGVNALTPSPAGALALRRLCANLSLTYRSLMMLAKK